MLGKLPQKEKNNKISAFTSWTSWLRTQYIPDEHFG